MGRDRAVYLETGALVAILLLAGFLRLGWAGVNSFSFDEARLSLMALEMAREGNFAALGMQSSLGFPNFPAAVWLLAPVYLLSADPLHATLVISAANTAAVLGVWYLARRAWGAWSGLAAALLFAASPFAVVYARNIWSQNLLAPLAILWALCGLWGVVHQRSWAVAACVFLAGFAPQVHFAGIVLVVPTIWLFVRYRWWRRWPTVLLGALAAALTALPFVYTIWCGGQGAQADLRQYLSQATEIDLTALVQVGQMAAGYRWERLLLGGGWAWEAPLGALVPLTRGLALALTIGGLLYLIFQAWRSRSEQEPSWAAVLSALIPIWALSSALAFLSHKGPIGPQYQLAALPALFLAAASLAGLRQPQKTGPLVGGLVLALAIVQTASLGLGLQTVAERLTPGGIGTPLERPRAMTQALMDGRPIVAHTEGDLVEYYGDAATFDLLLWDYPHRIVDGRSVLILPDPEQAGGDVHILAPFDTVPAWVELQAAGLDGQWRQFPRRKGEPPYQALTLSNVDLEEFQAAEPWSLASGARLRGWRVRQVDGRLRFSTYWRLDNPQAIAGLHQFNHLHSAESVEPLAIHDVPLSSQAWRDGDHLITWVEFEPPVAAGPYWLDVGMYLWPSLERSPVQERPGDPLAPIRLGPFDFPIQGNENNK